MSNLVFKILNDNGDIEITRFAKAEAVFKNPEYINEIFTEKKYINIFEMGKENEKLQQENQQLKEELKIKQDDFKCANEEINQLKEQVQDLKADYGTIAQIERDLYKEVINEAREVISGYIPNEHAMCKTLDKIEFILDKVKEK